MKNPEFVHLHVHSEYSLLDGAARIPDLIDRAARLEMPALAITDHGSMSGVIKFYRAAREAGINPIIGSEFYIAPGSRFEKTGGSASPAFHLVLLARDRVGYRNLLALSSKSHLEGFYYHPRIDRELLSGHHEGLIALSGCLKGEIPRALLAGDRAGAEKALGFYRDLFGPENFYLELTDQGLPGQRLVNPLLLEMSRKTGIGAVAANDVHYLNREDACSREVLRCIRTGSRLSDVSRMNMASEEFYLKSAGEMAALFSGTPEVLYRTREVADRCRLELELQNELLPEFTPPPGKKAADWMRELCEAGIPRRYGEKTEKLARRLEDELKVIEGKHFASYFLIVRDLIRRAKSREIPVGPGRGPAAGSLVAYLLGITDIDPFRHGLLFERFLNPDRTAMPDIDIDTSDRGRGELIRYAAKKYGSDRVARIATFDSLKARAVLREVGRVLGMSSREVDEIARLVPLGPRVSLKHALKSEPRLEKLYEEDERIKTLFDISFRLEGMPRHPGTHAAGVLISRRPLTEDVPLRRGQNDEVITQFDMRDAEEVGLVRFNFLCLHTISVIQNTIDLIEKSRGETIVIGSIPLDDPATFNLLSRGNTAGVFQLEGSGMKELSHRIGLKKFEDIVALVALYRPGPMHMLENYIARKRGRVKIEYDHPGLEPILKDTFGVILYQEQVMSIAEKLAGFTPAKADTLRRVMAGRQTDRMPRRREAFTSGAEERGIKSPTAEKIFKDMARFTRRAFCKAHGVAYALIAYRTAYLKAHYPREFMASLLAGWINNPDRTIFYVTECRRMGIEVLPPDINESSSGFTVEGKKIRFGFDAVLNLDASAADAILKARERGGAFTSFFELLDRLDLEAVDIKAVESLIKCSALDPLPGYRSQKCDALDDAFRRARRTRKARLNGRAISSEHPDREAMAGKITGFREMEEWPRNKCLVMEKELLGNYISGQPFTHRSDIA
ncbi:MAG: DNA polymerase III subunit alpha [Candidatus Erginobacter occultus]|nr:DNA polymerase III subunit alpha [Candidatus Erginobacter occultus]